MSIFSKSIKNTLRIQLGLNFRKLSYLQAAGSVAPGVGTVVGAIVGGIVGSLLLSYTGKKVSGALYDKNIQSKCPFCLN